MIDGHWSHATRLARLGAVAVLALSPLSVAHAQTAYTADDTLAAIDQASAEIGVDPSYLLRIVRCEDPTLDPYVVGDHGTSFGAVQLHQGGGELARFLAWGYSDIFDPYQSIRFLAQEITFGRARAWSCA
jgi:soluble lytic murein transglycosylase-like protein